MNRARTGAVQVDGAVPAETHNGEKQNSALTDSPCCPG